MALAASMLAVACGGSDSGEPTATATLSGVVTSTSGSAVDGARVKVGSVTATTGADGRFERKADPAFMAGRPGQDEAEAEARERDTAKRLWDALARIPCPTLVVRGAASDILSPEIADRMVDDVLANSRLAVVPRAAHSVMTDNPAGFAEAVSAFVLG